MPMKSERLPYQIGAVFGGFLSLGPLWGIIGTILSLNQAFTVLKQSGLNEPKALSSAISHTLVTTFAGFLICPIGVILLIYCLKALRKMDQETPPPL